MASDTAAQRATHLFKYEAWHFADQEINPRHDPTGEPFCCDDCPEINPWRDDV